jgi:hypothetical protein
VRELANLAFLDHATNVLFIGAHWRGQDAPGHQLGPESLPARRSVLFSSAAALLDESAAADVSHNLGRVLAHLRRVDLLIVDELGYFPMDGRRAGSRNDTDTVRPSPCAYRRALAGVPGTRAGIC